MKRALICGVSGQDGAYLAQQLLAEGYEVHGTSRDADGSRFGNLAALGVLKSVKLHSVAVNDFRSVLQTLTQVEPCEVYNLAGQSSVGLSFQQPVETLDSIARGTLNWLEAIRYSELPVKFYNACSGECFGNCPPEGANEETPFRPRSPYAVAKASAFWQVANYRDAYNVYACSGILFNHESPLRSRRFVTSKIVHAVVAIAEKREDELTLGNLDVQRDWGWAPEYVVAMRAMLQMPEPEDFVIATGQAQRLRDFVAAAFQYFDLDWQRHVRVDPALFRPAEIRFSRGCAEKADRLLNWRAQNLLPDVVVKMVQAELERTGRRDDFARGDSP